jgi:hypothetical protein
VLILLSVEQDFVDDVSYRLALVEDDGLERVVDKLLPVLLLKLDPTDGALMGKVRNPQLHTESCCARITGGRALVCHNDRAFGVRVCLSAPSHNCWRF